MPAPLMQIEKTCRLAPPNIPLRGFYNWDFTPGFYTFYTWLLHLFTPGFYTWDNLGFVAEYVSVQ
jgi:hypothetical protein